MAEVVVGHQYTRMSNRGKPERFTVLEILDNDSVKVVDGSSVEKTLPIHVLQMMTDQTLIQEEEMKRMQEEMEAAQKAAEESGESTNTSGSHTAGAAI